LTSWCEKCEKCVAQLFQLRHHYLKYEEVNLQGHDLPFTHEAFYAEKLRTEGIPMAGRKPKPTVVKELRYPHGEHGITM
jgi:hypothetical protein